MKKIVCNSQDFGVYFLLLSFFMSAAIAAEQQKTSGLKVIDDVGRVVQLAQVPQRVISLSPHATELIYAAGGGDKVIAVVEFSNFPAQAKMLPRVGSGYQLDVEAIVGLQPDLIIAWRSGNSREQLEQLESLGLSVYYSEPETLANIAKNLRDIGVLLATSRIADEKADAFLLGIEQLREKNKQHKKLAVFYQVWHQPLFTVNSQHIISQIIELCGGENIFAELSVLSPQVSIESLIERNPEVIVAGIGDGRSEWLPAWNRWPMIKAVKNKSVYGIDADLIVRHTPRILQGAEMMCEYLQQARSKAQ